MSIKDQINDFLRQIDQEHLGKNLSDLTDLEQNRFLAQLKKHGLERLRSLRKEFLNNSKPPIEDFKPTNSYFFSQDEKDIKKGEELVLDGKVGCLILAGGEGSRLNIFAPKGMAAVSLIKEKTLFQIFCEKTKAASKRANRPLHLALMTSPLNHLQTKTYLEDHAWFGLQPDQVDLFNQELKPFLDKEGNFLLKSSGVLAEGPDGNGASLKLFYQSKIWHKWKERGIRYVHLIVIDNPLTDPFDFNLCGFHVNQNADVTVKSIFREKENEKLGLLVEYKKQLKVIEYFEMTNQTSHAHKSDGSILYNLANISVFCFDMTFIETVANDKMALLPWHFAEKICNIQFKEGKNYIEKKIPIYKCETFIFDHLFLAKSPKVIVYPRSEVYSPLKNHIGEASFETVKQDLLAADRKQYKRVAQVNVDQEYFELDQAFYYPTKELLEKWKGKSLSNQRYIEP